MSFLRGSNLGARQREINNKVNDATKNNVKFEQIKDITETSDVEKICKIDVASKLKNIEYILEVFKSGDAFAIIRALNKCTWISDDEFLKYINPECLDHDVFPLMSIKMKQKFLTKLSLSLKDEKRATTFYQYCINEQFVSHIAPKFLRATSESYKIKEIKENYNLKPIEEKNLKHFIGRSFTLAEAYISSLTQPAKVNSALIELRSMYAVSNDDYLDLLETYYDIGLECNKNKKLGLRPSKSILKEYKARIYDNPSLYMHVLNPKAITKHSHRDEAELYANSVLPKEVSCFWSTNYCENYKFILDLVGEDEKFTFVKKIFNGAYPLEEFESTIHFINLKLYELMTVKEKEDWALRQIASGQELFGSGNNFMWCRFLTYNKAFEYIQTTFQDNPGRDKISDLYKVLLDSVDNQQDLEKLLHLYNNQFTDESDKDSESFINKIIEQNEVLEFNERCWAEFEKILYKQDLFNKLTKTSSGDIRVIVLMYYIINRKEVPDIINDILRTGEINFPTLMIYDRGMSVELSNKVYQYIFNYYEKEIKEISARTITEEKKRDLHKYLYCVLNLMQAYKKKKEDIPEFMNKLIRLEWEQFQYHYLIKTKSEIGGGDIRRFLKNNAALVVKEFQNIKNYFSHRFGNINWLFRKLRTYFSNDISKIYVNRLRFCLLTEDLADVVAVVAVRGIFTLGEDSDKISLMEEYMPRSLDDNDNVSQFSQRVLTIQRSICKQVCYSRPPLPQSCVTSYIIDEYVLYCQSLFRHYSMNLPQPLLFKFVELLIQKPFSIQRHGLILSFKYFNSDTLVTCISKTWGETTDPTVRALIYKTLIKKFENDTDEKKLKLFGILKHFTEDLKETDDENIYKYIIYLVQDAPGFPDNLKGKFLAAIWKAYSKFPESAGNLERMNFIMRLIESYVNLIPDQDLDDIINSHVHKMLENKEILNNYDEYHHELYKATWEVTARSFTYNVGEERLMKNVHLAKTILIKCVELWNEVKNGVYVIREFCSNFLTLIDLYSYIQDVDHYYNINILCQTIIGHLTTSLPDHETYMLIWNLRLSVDTKAILVDETPKEICENDELPVIIIKCMVKLAEAFGNTMQEYINNNKYFPSFQKAIEKIILHKILTIKQCLDRDDYINVTLIDMTILLCTGLVQFETREMYMFMLEILPNSYSDLYVDEYKSVIKTIKSFPDKEVNYCLYEKWVSSGFSSFIDTF